MRSRARNGRTRIDTTYKRRLIAFSLLLGIVPVLVIGLLSSYLTSRSIREEVARNHQIILKQLDIQVDAFMRSLDRTSLDLANSQVVQASLRSGISTEKRADAANLVDTVLKAAGSADVEFQVALYYTNFNLLYSSQDGINRYVPYPYPEIVSTAAANRSGLTVIPPGSYPSRPEMMLVRGVPLGSPNPDGYLILQLNISRFKQFLDRLDLGDHRKLLIVDETGSIVASRDFDEVGSNLSQAAGMYRYWAEPGFNSGAVTLDDVRYNVSSFRSSFNGWTYIALSSQTDLIAKSQKIRYAMWGLIAGVAAVWSVVALVGSRTFYLPVQRLAGKFGAEAANGQGGWTAIHTSVDRMLDRNEQLERSLREQSFHLKEFRLHRLLHDDLPAQEAAALLNEWDMAAADACFLVVAVDIDRYLALDLTYTDRDRHLAHQALRGIAEEAGAAFVCCIVASPMPGRLVLLIGARRLDELSRERMTALCGAIRDRAASSLPFTVSTAVSAPRRGPAGIGVAYRDVQELAQHRWIGGSGQHIDADKLETAMDDSVRSLVALRADAVARLMEGNVELAGAQLARLIGILTDPPRHPEASRSLFMLFLGEIDQRLNELGHRNLREMFAYDVLEHMHSLQSLEEVHRWMRDDVFHAVASQLQADQMSRRRKWIEQARRYIDEHFETDVSLQELAGRFGLAAGTLSRAFKEESGENFVDYLIRVRMTKAKEWLLHTDMPIKTMAERLRYSSVHNFNRIFKRVTGVPPGHFRKSVSGDSRSSGNAAAVPPNQLDGEGTTAAEGEPDEGGPTVGGR
ncbi:AraC family transcriptional regulator [Paenibacillus cymbidii]|uniref:AraC family transcriptional regulator n=1 Tax=Paenibacillus cymbidii TaxID=1639034 RepID=UPI0014368722|nr:AraC family transcriptional regulator [Paenibacillus cymbidii]